MKSSFRIILLLALATTGLQPSAFAQELRQMQEEWLPAENILLDTPDRGLLIIASTIPGLKFTANRPLPLDPSPPREIMPGVWHVYLSLGTTLLTIQADGYLPLQDLRVHVGPRDVKKLRLTAKPVFGAFESFDVSRPEIRLFYKPSDPDEKVFGDLDGNIIRLDFSTGEARFRPSPGKHTLRLNSQGRIWQKTFDLAAGQTAEEQVVFTGRAAQTSNLPAPGFLYVNSDPPGAAVYLNQAAQGVTPLTLDDLPPGTYRVEVAKDLYLPAAQVVEVKSLEYADANFKLVPNFGRVKIDSDPAGATVWINNQQRGTTPLEIPRISAGKYQLRLAQSLYYDAADTFEIKPGDQFVRAYRLKPQFGSVFITTAPPGATVTADGTLWGTTPLSRDRVPSGQHTISITLPDYFEEEAVLTVADDERTEKHYPLRPSVGWLTVNSQPPGALVVEADQSKSLGITPLRDAPLPPGTYRIRLELADYEPHETALVLNYGARETLDAVLVRSAGHLRVSTQPQGARIFLDGEFRGESPLVLKEVPVGTHQIRLEKSGYDIHLGAVRINRGEVTKFDATLSAEGYHRWMKNRRRAVAASVLVPGLGQLIDIKEGARGYIYLAAFLGCVAQAEAAYRRYKSAVDDLDYALLNYSQPRQTTLTFDSTFAVYSEARRVAAEKRLNVLTWTGAAAIIYIWQLTDAYLWGGGKKPVAPISAAPLHPTLVVNGNTATLNLSFSWGKTR